MGNKIVDIKIPVGMNFGEVKVKALKKIRVSKGDITILKKSLDSRKKVDIRWQYRLLIHSKEIKSQELMKPDLDLFEKELVIKRKAHDKSDETVIVVGSGPAGIFPAIALAIRGYKVRLIEQGQPVEERQKSIQAFESGGKFPAMGNYSYGEGGAGTFSDGKLTSRSKGISKERDFLISQYLKAGAPEEIAYLAHPHLGSDNLYTITQSLRRRLISLGGEIHFEHKLEDMEIRSGKVERALINGKYWKAHHILIAPGHSSYESFRMLMKHKIPFRSKVMALGFRAEHLQESINLAQWGKSSLPGVKAAEYRLTAGVRDSHRVYSFCMCPGGKVVPAAPREDLNIVNGMSLYQRNSPWANAAVLCSFHPSEYLGENPAPMDILHWLEELEQSFKEITGDFRAPSCTIEDFLKGELNTSLPQSSYPLGLKETALWEHLPSGIIHALQEGLSHFSSKLKDYDKGILLGLESKSSSPIQLLRDDNRNALGVENLYIAGEGSGWSGGIVSSAADGLRCCASLLE